MNAVPDPEAEPIVPVDLDSPLAKPLGTRVANLITKAFGYSTAGELLGHFPRRYARRGELTALSTLPIGDDVTIVGEVVSASSRRMQARKGNILEVRVTDGKGVIALTFFNQAWRLDELRAGARGIFSGKVTAYKGSLQLAHPNYELFPANAAPVADPAAAAKWAMTPVPIYPATASLPSWKLKASIDRLLAGLTDAEDPVPADIARDRGLLSFVQALHLVHEPETDAEWRAAQESLRFQEAFVLQAALLQQRAAARSVPAEPRIARADGYRERFDAALKFTLTDDQTRVGDEIDSDLAQTEPMSRLVQGEVGSGKTLVALRAMLAVADSGGQAALLAPTEVLAAQHLRSIVAILGPDLSVDLMPTLLTGQLSAAERRKSLLRVVSGQARIVVGTHALIGESVTFYDLGLVVVDEQHRFGVDQREALRLKGNNPPHTLVLTATPIPRTVAMTVFGDLDVSTISQLPAGRQGIDSFVVPLAEKPGWEGRIWARASEEIAKGRQVFVVCPAISPKDIEDGDELEEDEEPGRPIASVESVFAGLKDIPALNGSRTAMLHGRMTSEEKDSIMRAFAAGELDVIVATTVIEVGVDVPNASAMIVLDADRFGVSQLHQLRGRVGRGAVPGICLFVTHAEEGTLARERVDAVASTLDGFALAQIDLELRREGNVLGSAQSGGRSSLRLLRVVHDAELIAEARQLAAGVIDIDPTLADHRPLAAALRRRLDESERDFLAKT
jgi:ATP-dependent DNA helicase RecG